MWKQYNPNPEGKNTGDCVVRAISIATGCTWEEIYLQLCIAGFIHHDWGHADAVWGEYLHQRGWKRRFVRSDCPVCYTVKDFCREYPNGTYILGIQGHAVAVIDGEYWDTWDSGDKNPIYYWEKEN